MERPNEQQVQDACAILKTNKRVYGQSGAEGSDRRAVFSILAALGGPGTVAEEYHTSLEEAPKAKGPMIDAPAAKAETVATEPAEAWFDVITEQENGAAQIVITGENEYGFAVGETFELTYNVKDEDDALDEDEPEETPDEEPAAPNDPTGPIIPTDEEIGEMGFEDLKEVASNEGVDMSGIKSKADARKAILKARKKADKAVAS